MIRRKPVPNQPSLFPEAELPRRPDSGTDAFLNKLQPLDGSETPDCVSRKPLSRSGTGLEKAIRGPPDLTFVWGAKLQASVASEFFYFISGRGINSSTLPLSLRKLAKELNPSKIKRILAATIGPEDDCFAAWQDHDDEYKWILRRSPQPSRYDKVARKKWLDSRQSISHLEEWLSRHLSKPFAISTARVVLGPEGSYFASHLELSPHDHTAEIVATWDKLPQSLLDLRERREALRGPAASVPIMIVLGVENAWVVVWSNREASWELAGKYEGLARQLENRDGRGVETLFLSAVEEEQYYIQFSDRVAYLSAPILHSDLELLNACLISSLLQPKDTPTSPTSKVLDSTATLASSTKPPPSTPINPATTSPIEAPTAEPLIFPASPPSVLNVSVISDRDFHSPFISLPTIPPIPRSKLKFVHFAKAPEGAKGSWHGDNVTANMRQASDCPIM